MNSRRALAGPSIGFLAVLAVLFIAIPAIAEESAQWTVVTPPAFRATLAPLIQQRQAQGFKVVVLETTDVFSPEQMQHGDGSPLLAEWQCDWASGPFLADER